MIEFGGSVPEGSADDQLARGLEYCASLEAGASLDEILATMPDVDLEAEIGLFVAATLILCPDYRHMMSV